MTNSTRLRIPEQSQNYPPVFRGITPKQQVQIQGRETATWKTIAQQVISAAKPDMVVVYTVNPYQVLFQENFHLKVSGQPVTTFTLLKIINPTDMMHIQAVDRMMILLAHQWKFEPHAFLSQVLFSITNHDGSSHHILRTNTVIENDEKGMPLHGMMCYFDLSSLTHQSRPGNVSIKLNSEWQFLEKEIERRLGEMTPKK